jgi:hypothetical protein
MFARGALAIAMCLAGTISSHQAPARSLRDCLVRGRSAAEHKCMPVAFADVSARLSKCLDSEQRGNPGCLVPHLAALRS